MNQSSDSTSKLNPAQSPYQTNVGDASSIMSSTSSKNVDSTVSSGPQLATENKDPEVIEKETVVVKEKGGSKGCMSFSLKSCFCWGCALLVLGSILLVGFMYMVFFSDIGFFSNMRKGISERADAIFTGEVPTYNNVSVSDAKNGIENLDIDTNNSLTLNLSQDEFNSLVNQNVSSALSTDNNTTGIENLTLVAQFQEDRAEAFVKVDDPALPTFKVIFINDNAGQVSIESAKVLGIEISGQQLQGSLEGEGGEAISPSFIFETLILGDKADQFIADSIQFKDNSIMIHFTVREE